MAYPGEGEILAFLKEKKETTLEELSESCNLNMDTARRALESLKEKGFLVLKKQISDSEEENKELQSYRSKGEFPEYSVYKKAKNNSKISDLSNLERNIGLQWALRKKWVLIKSGALQTLEKEQVVEKTNSLLLSSLKDLSPNAKEELIKRKLLTKKLRTTINISITEKGLSEKIKESSFSTTVETKDAEMGKSHPHSRAASRMKEIFVEMGFEEMDGECIESTFWNFDALFQPQDHPARELADTFYVDKSFSLPDHSIVKRVKDSHEKGWKYKWKESEARKGILRTHTTNLSAKTLASLKKPYGKYFSVGRVFRNEATDFKHLSEFFQVEGIVAWKDATFRDLLGVLKEFFRKLGFEEIRFRPSYFPYTEPSLEVEVYYEPKKEWMELGGAGIFRPSVTKPLTDIYPVLAWGLSLERPLMLSLGIKDMRTFYKNDLDWLKSSRVSR